MCPRPSAGRRGAKTTASPGAPCSTVKPGGRQRPVRIVAGTAPGLRPHGGAGQGRTSLCARGPRGQGGCRCAHAVCGAGVDVAVRTRSAGQGWTSAVCTCSLPGPGPAQGIARVFLLGFRSAMGRRTGWGGHGAEGSRACGRRASPEVSAALVRGLSRKQGDRPQPPLAGLAEVRGELRAVLGVAQSVSFLLALWGLCGPIKRTFIR